MAAMVISPGFEIVFNRVFALRQEYEMGRKDYDEAFDLPYNDPDRDNRFRAARARRDRAKELLARA